MKLGYKCVEARWDEGSAKWTAKFENVQSGNMIEDTGDVFMTGIGALNEWKWPRHSRPQGLQGRPAAQRELGRQLGSPRQESSGHWSRQLRDPDSANAATQAGAHGPLCSRANVDRGDFWDGRSTKEEQRPRWEFFVPMEEEKEAVEEGPRQLRQVQKGTGSRNARVLLGYTYWLRSAERSQGRV